MDGTTDSNSSSRHSGRVTVYNLTGQEVGCIIDGRMYAVPAGQIGGGRGTLVVPEHVARQMLERCAGQLTMSPGGYGADDAALVREMVEDELRAFVEALLRGEAPPVAVFRAAWRREHEADNRPSGRPAAKPESGVRP